MSRTWSTQQEDIFEFFANGTGNAVVEALAGTGKTTTIIEGVNRAPERRIVLCAFNKRIAEELQTRITNSNATAKTLHSLGFGIVRRNRKNVRILNGSERADAITDAVCSDNVPAQVRRAISNIHSKGREMNPHARNLGDLTDIIEQFSLAPDASFGYDVETVEMLALDAMEYAANNYGEIDFSDMIFLPVRNRWMSKEFDLVVVDEAQDMTVAQLEIAQGVCSGRIVVVGDPNQAIYGFRGADSDSLPRLKDELKARTFPLTVTYRCGKAIVKEAQRLVPTFEAGPNNPDGIISEIEKTALVASANLGDFILSRLNAPLVSVAMALLRSGKRTRIAGRDIGKGLIDLTQKLTRKSGNSIPMFLAELSKWEEKELDRLMKAKNAAISKLPANAGIAGKARVENRFESKSDFIRDQAEMLVSLAADAKGVRDVESNIAGLFTDDGLGQSGVITCSSVHRAKGLEAPKVFVLSKTLYPRGVDREEQNIEYVAITRAKNELVWVVEPTVAA